MSSPSVRITRTLSRRSVAAAVAILVTISIGLPVAPIRAATTPTTTTLTGPADPVDAPDLTRFTVQVTPAPFGAPGFLPAINIAVDGGPSLPSGPLQADGSAIIDLALAVGSHSVVASFGGIGEFEPSTSGAVVVSVGSATTTTLTSNVNPALSTVPVTLTATVGGKTGIYGTTAPPNAGTLTIRDQTTSTVLGSKTVASGDTTLAVTTTMAVGDHDLRAEYEGSGVFRSSSASVLETITLDTGVAASGVGLTPSTFYPVKDGYRDRLKVRGARSEPISVVIKVYSVKTGKLVRTASLALGTGAYAWYWNGRSAAGTLQKAGRYRVLQVLTDTGANSINVTSYVTLSRKKMHWTTAVATLAGNRYIRVLDPGTGYVSRGKSGYASGVKIYAGTSAAGVQYRFRIHSARFYRKISFRVLGKSTNGGHAVLVIWNPDLGSYKYLESFDAARLAGPGYRWWTTSASLTGRTRSGYARAGVIVVYSGGQKNAFDIAKVKVVYQYGVLR